MKKFISILTAITILCGLCIPASAEHTGGLIDEQYSDDVKVSVDTNYFIKGEEIYMEIMLGQDIGYVEEIETAKIYIDCNKDAMKYTGDLSIYSTENTAFVMDETDSGYLVTYTCTPDTDGCEYSFVAFCTFEITGNGSPDISVRCEKKVFGGEMKEASVSLTLPENIVYEKDDIPHIVTNLKPPVFGDRVSFNAYGIINVYAPQTIDEILAMLSPSDGVSKIKHIPCNDIERDYVTTGDSFVLEFGGKICQEIVVNLKGDADSDGLITSKDARLTLRYSAGLEERINNSADINFDDKKDAADARMILRVAAKIDYFRHKDIVVWENQKFKVGPLVSASDGGYMWRCTVSEEGAIEVTETIEPSVDNTGKEPDEIFVGAPALQTFMLKPLKQGKFYVHFELIRPWESKPIKEFGFTIIADDVLN